MFELGQIVRWRGLKGVIILNPKYQRKIIVSFGSRYGVWFVPRKELEEDLKDE